MDFLFAQETASAGNGGGAMADANGGAVAAGDVNSGSNMGNMISVAGEDSKDHDHGTWGDVDVHGGAIANTTNLGMAAGGGSAIADASGGDYNVAFVS